MLGEKHTLTYDFPDHIPLIEHLRATHASFADMADEYDRIDKLIYRIEMGEETASESFLEECKFERVRLKDTLFSIIRQKEAGL